MKPIFTDHHPARRTQCALTANSYQLAATRAQASAHTPAKMAREMLEADRRAQKRRHRARRARPVHTSEGAALAAPTKRLAKASEASALDLLLAAILWGLALVCVGITLAIAAGIALHLLGVE